MPETYEHVQDADCPPEMQPFLDNEGGDGPPDVVVGERKPIQCLQSQEFWLLFATSAICSGCGLTLLNNLAQMVRYPGAVQLMNFFLQDSKACCARH